MADAERLSYADVVVSVRENGRAMVTIDELLWRARLPLVRLTPHQAWAAMQNGAVLVDSRPEFQRRADGDIPGAVVIERVHLESLLDRLINTSHQVFVNGPSYRPNKRPGHAVPQSTTNIK